MKLNLITICTFFAFSVNFLLAEKPKDFSATKNQNLETVPSVTRRIKYNIAVLPKNWFEILSVKGANPVKSKLVFNRDTAQEDFFEDLVCAVDDTEKVNVIERAKLQAMFREQNLQNTGRVSLLQKFIFLPEKEKVFLKMISFMLCGIWVQTLEQEI